MTHLHQKEPRLLMCFVMELLGHFSHIFLLLDAPNGMTTSWRAMTYEQRTKPITSAKGRGWNGHRFLCVPHRSWGFNGCNKIRQTCVSKVIVFCVTPIVPESFMIVSSINVLVWLFQIVGGFGGRSYDENSDQQTEYKNAYCKRIYNRNNSMLPPHALLYSRGIKHGFSWKRLKSEEQP